MYKITATELEDIKHVLEELLFSLQSGEGDDKFKKRAWEIIESLEENYNIK